MLFNLKPELKNILVIQTAFIGDAILASSVLEKLHQSFPQSKISLLLKKGNESLYVEHPFLNEVLVWNKGEGKYASLFNTLKQVRALKFDAVINLHRFMSSGFITAFSGAKYKAGYSETPFSFLFTKKVKHIIGDGRHETVRYNERKVINRNIILFCNIGIRRFGSFRLCLGNQYFFNLFGR